MANESIRVIGATWCPDCRRAKKFLADQRVAYEWIDLEQEPEAVSEVLDRNGGARIIPTIIFPDGSHLAEPSNEELADKLGLRREAQHTAYDLVIVGGGPTGLTTAIYAARENLSVLIVERSAPGGQAGVTERLDNYPGFPDGVAGSELADRMRQQAERYGVEILEAVGVESLDLSGGERVVVTAKGQRYRGSALLIATGSTYRRTGAEGESELIGAGIHFCATCDGPFYRDAEEVVVVGGGNSGLEEGLFLTQFARHVTVVEYADQLKASRLLQDKVRDHPDMLVKTGQEIVRFVASESGTLSGVELRERASGDVSMLDASGAFVFVGLDPNTDFVADLLDRDAQGFLITDEQFATSALGVYAAGDVRRGSTKQLASAVGEGAGVALQIRYFLDRQRP